MQSNFDLLRDKIVIIDEAHHLRSQTTQMMFLIGFLDSVTVVESITLLVFVPRAKLTKQLILKIAPSVFWLQLLVRLSGLIH